LRHEGPWVRVAKRIWTLGYEGRDPNGFVAALREADVQRVVDVRELPLSRKVGFSKASLARGLEAAGIAYTHLRALGTPRPIRHALKSGGDPETFRRDYRAYAETQPEALAQLEDLARRERVAMLCVEATADVCHRGVLGEMLKERGWRVTHL